MASAVSTTAKESRPMGPPPVPAERMAWSLSLAVFGPLGLLLILWSFWCLGWLGATATANILVVGSLTLVAGYDIQLVRYHKGLATPPLTIKGRIKAWLFWAVTASFIYQMIWKQGGFASGTLGVLVALEAICAFINFLDARLDYRRAEIVVAQGILHALGWLLFLGMLFYGMQCYLAPMLNLPPSAALYGLPPFLITFLFGFIRTLSVPGTAALGLVLIAAAYGLRLWMYAKRDGIPLRQLFRLGVIGTVAFFLTAAVFCTMARGILAHRLEAGVKAWETATGESIQMPDAMTSEDAARFAAFQMEIGTGLQKVSGSFNTPINPPPYHWEAFSNRSLGEDLPEFFLDKTPLAEADLARFKEYREALEPVFQLLDQLEAMLPEIPDARVSRGIMMLEDWRLATAIRMEEWTTAQASMASLRILAGQGMASGDIAVRCMAFDGMIAWTKAAALLPEEFREGCRPQAEELSQRVNDLSEDAVLLKLVRSHHMLMEEFRTMNPGFHSWGAVLPYFEMMTLADETAFLGVCTGKAPSGQQEIPVEGCTLYTRLSLKGILEDYRWRREELLNRLEELR